jgi:hypothetical protein
MSNSIQLSSIAFSPVTTNAIVKYCEGKIPQEGGYYWSGVKSGIDTVVMHRRVAILSALVFSFIQAAPVDDLALWSASAVTGLVLAFSLGALYINSKKIHTLIKPHLNIACCGAEPLLLVRPQPTATAERVPDAGYGTASGAVKV